MSHSNDNEGEIVGLLQAVAKLPQPFCSWAYAEFHRALADDRYAEFSGPDVIYYREAENKPMKKALLVIIQCENFFFDLFFVMIGRGCLVPVVGRAYFSPTEDCALTVN